MIKNILCKKNGGIMDFREINTFIHVANQESFSKAADVLGYTQAAVSIQIKQLESELGTRLFDRIGKHISLTHQGKVFYQYALHITSEIEEAKDVLSGSQDLNGTLRIGTIESICSSILPDILSRYHALHPAVEISIITDSPEALLDMMNKSRVDLVYFMDKRMYDPKWVKILEEPENIIFVASPDHPCTKKSPLTLNKIISEPFIKSNHYFTVALKILLSFLVLSLFIAKNIFVFFDLIPSISLFFCPIPVIFHLNIYLPDEDILATLLKASLYPPPARYIFPPFVKSIP